MGREKYLTKVPFKEIILGTIIAIAGTYQTCGVSEPIKKISDRLYEQTPYELDKKKNTILESSVDERILDDIEHYRVIGKAGSSFYWMINDKCVKIIDKNNNGMGNGFFGFFIEDLTGRFNFLHEPGDSFGEVSVYECMASPFKDCIENKLSGWNVDDCKPSRIL